MSRIESRPTVAVCAMGKRPFTSIAARWIDELRRLHVDVVDRRSVEVRRSGAIDALNGGADVVLYAGHGRERGWSGYQTLRSAHLVDTDPPDRPTDLVLACACRTAGAGSGEFADELVASGRVAAYAGWVDDMSIEDGLAVADRFVELLGAGWNGSVAALIDAVIDRTTDPGELACARGVRVIGDPGVVVRTDRSLMSASST